MADLGKAYVQIIPKAEGISEKIKSTVAPGAGSAGSSAGSTFAANFKKMIVSAGIGTAVIGGLKAALDEGGKLQQSYGGLDTLYGDAAQAAKDYSIQAAQAGISANDYAEQAVSFGASLKAAFKGDTTKAVEAANTAILDMADNAAKMGTPLENIQNAYQGFAKGNYTMLDNLKLGYGGTKSEMERLLSDATKLTGVKYDMNNLGDVYSAIHAIQDNLGLTGVAAAEAAETFSGSFGAMKAAAKNFLGALTTGGDVSGAMSTLIKSTGTFIFGNLVPMLGTLVKALPEALRVAFEAGRDAIVTNAPVLISGLIDGIMAKIPEVITTGREFINKLRDGIINNAPVLWENAKTTVTDFVQKVTESVAQNAPVLWEKALTIVSDLGGKVKGAVLQYAPKLWETVQSLIGGFYAKVAEAAPQLINMGGEFITRMSEGIVAYLPTFAEKAVAIINAIGGYLIENLPVIGAHIATFMQNMGATLIENIPVILSAIWNAAPTVLAAIGDIGAAIVQNIVNLLPTIADLGFQAISGLATGMGGAALGLVQKAMDAIRKAMEEPIQNAKNTINGVIEKIKGFFPINIGRILDNISLPRISVDGGEAPYGLMGRGYPPSFDISWNAKGGIFDGASIIGVGEAGPEAVIPLSSDRMRPFARAIAEEMGGAGGTYTIVVPVEIDGREVARSTATFTRAELRRLDRIDSRKAGVAW